MNLNFLKLLSFKLFPSQTSKSLVPSVTLTSAFWSVLACGCVWLLSTHATALYTNPPRSAPLKHKQHRLSENIHTHIHTARCIATIAPMASSAMFAVVCPSLWGPLYLVKQNKQPCCIVLPSSSAHAATHLLLQSLSFKCLSQTDYPTFQTDLYTWPSIKCHRAEGRLDIQKREMHNHLPLCNQSFSAPVSTCSEVSVVSAMSIFL